MSDSFNDIVEDNNEPVGYTRKRKVNLRDWKTTVCKQKRNSGEAYTSRITKQLVPARSVGPPCKCNCFSKIGENNIKIIFDSFWAIGDYNLQNTHLSKLLSSTDIHKSTVKNRPSRTLRRIKYTVMLNSEFYEVCCKAFYSIHGLSEKRVRTVLNKQNLTGVVSTDQRGHHIPARKI